MRALSIFSAGLLKKLDAIRLPPVPRYLAEHIRLQRSPSRKADQ
jgi:hypothetical protein